MIFNKKSQILLQGVVNFYNGTLDVGFDTANFYNETTDIGFGAVNFYNGTTDVGCGTAQIFGLFLKWDEVGGKGSASYAALNLLELLRIGNL